MRIVWKSKWHSAFLIIPAKTREKEYLKVFQIFRTISSKRPIPFGFSPEKPVYPRNGKRAVSVRYLAQAVFFEITTTCTKTPFPLFASAWVCGKFIRSQLWIVLSKEKRFGFITKNHKTCIYDWSSPLYAQLKQFWN